MTKPVDPLTQRPAPSAGVVEQLTIIAAQLRSNGYADWPDWLDRLQGDIALIEQEAVAAVRPGGSKWKATSQETIQETTADDYLDLLERMVEQGKQRNDPTLAVAVSIGTLELLVAEARAFRLSRGLNERPL